ncbi:sensor histidine kinase [Micromonospora sp. DT229]|uniref:sensor histidine kinase n=1 Tax=Micromonospora sp. DT229 TaxID=3393430 RepID=UPI003CEC5A22
MRRVGTEEWSGLAMLVVAVAVATPGLFGGAELRIGRGWWIALFVLLLAGLLTAPAASEQGRVRHLAYGVAVVAAWALVLTTRQVGLLPVLLVLTAAMSVYLVPLPVGLVVVALNTAVIILVAVPTTRTPGELGLIVGFYLLIQLASLLSSMTLLREQRMRRELAAAHVELKAAGLRLEESARTQERLRISRELHDLIGHQLTVLTLELETARHLDGAAVQRHVERADRVARELLGDVRTTVGHLRTEAVDLEEALRRLARDLPGLEVSIEVSPQVCVDEERGAALVRAAQEIITNTIRHAEARELRISITGQDGVVALDACDDGRGAGDPAFGNGLRGLRERFEALGGDLVVDGSAGFRVTARMPTS